MKYGKILSIVGIIFLIAASYLLYDWGTAFRIYCRHYKYWLIGMAIIGLIFILGIVMVVVGYREMKYIRKISN